MVRGSPPGVKSGDRAEWEGKTMIVSASRRTDLPAHYMPWLLGRLSAGFCVAVNPFNPTQRRRVSLDPEEVDALVLWTRDPGAVALALPRIESLGHQRTIALVTITGYSSDLEPAGPRADKAAEGFKRLAGVLGDPRRLAWRYDPILFGPKDTPADHRHRFESLARNLEGSTRRVIVSFLDLYRKTTRRLAGLNYPLERPGYESGPEARSLLSDLAAMASVRGMILQSCAEPFDFADQGVNPGRCIDPVLLGELFPGRTFPRRKDPGQRPPCGCAPSVDIGMPDTCLSGCAYCYAVKSLDLARERHARHDPAGESVIPD